MKKVSVICIDCEPGFIDILLGMQTYTDSIRISWIIVRIQTVIISVFWNRGN